MYKVYLKKSTLSPFPLLHSLASLTYNYLKYILVFFPLFSIFISWINRSILCFLFPTLLVAGIHFPESLLIQCRHVTDFSPNECRGKRLWNLQVWPLKSHMWSSKICLFTHLPAMYKEVSGDFEVPRGLWSYWTEGSLVPDILYGVKPRQHPSHFQWFELWHEWKIILSWASSLRHRDCLIQQLTLINWYTIFMLMLLSHFSRVWLCATP